MNIYLHHSILVLIGYVIKFLADIQRPEFTKIKSSRHELDNCSLSILIPSGELEFPHLYLWDTVLKGLIILPQQK